MTRKEIESDYRIENGIIRSPGKFEGEAVYLPAFYDVYLNGWALDDGNVLSVAIEAEDKIEFPELKKRKRVRFIVRDDGFVCEV